MTTYGAFAPWTSTAPITRSARGSSSSIASVDEKTVDTRPDSAVSSSRSRSMLRSSTKTSASMPTAMNAAFRPTTPPPMIMTVAGATPGTPPSRMPAAAERLLEHERARLGRDLARHLAHRREQRQPAALVLDRLVRDAGRAGLDQRARQLGVGRQVQVREERVLGPQPRDLLGQRLLDLDDHLGLGETASASGDDPRALRLVVGVADGAALAGAGLDEDLVADVGQVAHARGGHGDAVLVLLDLRRDSDSHRNSSLALSANQNSIRSRALPRSRPVSSSTLRIR